MRVRGRAGRLDAPIRPGVKAPWRRKRHDVRLEALRGSVRARDGSAAPQPNVFGRPPEGRREAPEAPPAAVKRPRRNQKPRRRRCEPHALRGAPPSRRRPVDRRVLRPGPASRDGPLVWIARVVSFAKSREAFQLRPRAWTSTALRRPLAADAANSRRRVGNTTR
jgi:hypothetical protein